MRSASASCSAGFAAETSTAVELHGVAHLHLPLLAPDGVHDGLVAGLQPAPLYDVEAREPRVTLEGDAVYDAHAEARVARVRVLPDGDGRALALDLLHLVGAPDGQREALRAGEAGRPRGAQHYLRATSDSL